MNATQTRSSLNGANTYSLSNFPLSFVPGAIAFESAFLAQILAFRLSEMWLYLLEDGVKIEHDLLMNLLGYEPHEHIAPWDQLHRGSSAWLEAIDKGLAAAGE